MIISLKVCHKGQIIQNISLNSFGEGSIDVDKSNMSNSTYYYSLFVDGRRIETKKDDS